MLLGWGVLRTSARCLLDQSLLTGQVTSTCASLKSMLCKSTKEYNKDRQLKAVRVSAERWDGSSVKEGGSSRQ